MNFRKAGLLITGIILLALFLLNRKDVTLVKQDSFELLPVSATGDEYKSVIHLCNPNLLSSTIKTIKEKYSIKGIQIGELNAELNQGIPGRKETAFPVSIRFSKDDYYKAMHYDTTKQKEVKVLIEGEIIFQNFTGGGTINIHQTEVIAQRDL